jgi:hypothetical protein
LRYWDLSRNVEGGGLFFFLPFLDLLLDFFVIFLDEFFEASDVRYIQVQFVDIDPCIVDVDGADGDEGSRANTFRGVVSTRFSTIWALVFGAVILDVAPE